MQRKMIVGLMFVPGSAMMGRALTGISGLGQRMLKLSTLATPVQRMGVGPDTQKGWCGGILSL
jgi:hypothetical protein